MIEAYAPGVDFPVANGGRYDRLLAAFDWPIPAVGFTLDLDRLHEALVDEGAGVTRSRRRRCPSAAGSTIPGG